MQQNERAAQKSFGKSIAKTGKKAAAKRQTKPKADRAVKKPEFVQGFEIGSKVWQHFEIDGTKGARLVKVVGVAPHPDDVMVEARAPGEKRKTHQAAINSGALVRQAPFKKNQLLKSPVYGMVKFVRDIDGKTVEVSAGDAAITGHHVDQLEALEKAYANQTKTANQELKKRFGLVVGDDVRLTTRDNAKATIIAVRFETEDENDRRLVVNLLRRDLDVSNPDAAMVEFEGIVSGFQFEAWKAVKEPKLRFADVPLFGAFVIGEQTFVKTGNSSGIRVPISGTSSEPFAMLATKDAPLSKSAKRSFKQSDKVKNFVAQQ